MAGDLEDFLKRAAERRAQKQQQGGGAQPHQRPAAQQRPKPQYTESRRERQVRQPIQEAIPVAEIVEPVNSLAEKQKRLAEAKKRADEARAQRGNPQSEATEVLIIEDGDTEIPAGTPAEQLIELIRRPGGIQQAFLLREILERPEQRWK